MSNRDIANSVWALIEPHLREQGFELVEVEYVQQAGRWSLRVFIDCPGGVTLDHCQAASQMLSPLLDAEQAVQGSYVLEVSSPGLDRPLRKPEDFERFTGELIKLKTYAPVEGRKRFTGSLCGFRDGMITVDCDGAAYNIHIENLHKANLDR